MGWVDGSQRLVPEAVVHAVPETFILQFFYHLVYMIWTPMSLDHLSHQIQEHLHDIRRIGRVRKDPTASDDEITEDIKQNSLRPGRVLALLPVRCDNLEGTSIEHLRQLQLG